MEPQRGLTRAHSSLDEELGGNAIPVSVTQHQRAEPGSVGKESCKPGNRCFHLPSQMRTSVLTQLFAQPARDTPAPIWKCAQALIGPSPP